MTAVRFRPEAETDLAEAQAWYDEQRAGLGDELLEEIHAVVRRVAAMPAQFPLVHGETRRALVRRFPYAVFFVAGVDGPTVLGVFHQAVDPARSRSRAH